MLVFMLAVRLFIWWASAYIPQKVHDVQFGILIFSVGFPLAYLYVVKKAVGANATVNARSVDQAAVVIRRRIGLRTKSASAATARFKTAAKSKTADRNGPQTILQWVLARSQWR